MLLQHDQGRLALERGDVDAWAGLDPMMADAEISSGFPLFFRNADANTYGVLNVREAFAGRASADRRAGAEGLRARPPMGAGEPGRAREDPGHGRQAAGAGGRQATGRTQFVDPNPGDAERQTITAAGKALQTGGVIKPDVDIAATVAPSLLQPSFATSVIAAAP